MASSSIVIKVKFGETLRRFNALLSEEGLTLDFSMLREKIRSLFGFSHDVVFSLTYIDEDGDVVTLADENDLRDVVQQSLNPLRITVNVEEFCGSHWSSGSPSPLRLPQDNIPFQTLNSGVSGILKSVPEPLRDTLSKLSVDLTSKAVSSAPGLAELVDKLTTTYINQLSGSRAGSTASTPTAAQENTMDAPKPSEKLQDTHLKSSTKGGAGSIGFEVGSSNSKNKAYQFQKVTDGVKLQDVQLPRPVDLNAPYIGSETFPPQVNPNGVIGSGRPSYSQDVTVDAAQKANSGVEKLSASDKKKDIRGEPSEGVEQNPLGFGATATNDCLTSSWLDQHLLNVANQCPFSGMPLSSDINWHSNNHSRRGPSFKRGHNHGNGLTTIFHRGVRCDGCGVHPITGSRYKSKVKDDYDLCGVCFAEMGNDADYMRFDRPVNFRHPFPFLKGFHNLPRHMPPAVPAHVLRAPGTRRAKLDSRFILDVNVLDGTMMAPSTKFTKIWRMRNNGNVIWPRGSQLLWIGGDRLSSVVSVEVEMPAEGLAVDKEIDIAVDFTAPELPGRYISYWRMAAPTGQKFGQRVWVLVQVDATNAKDLGETSINLNLPPSTGVKNPEGFNLEGDQPIPNMSDFVGPTWCEDPFLGMLPTKDQDINFPINDSLIIDNGSSSMATVPPPPPPAAAGSSSISYPKIETEVANVVGERVSVFPSHPAAVEEASNGNGNENGNDNQEQTLLRELDEMGFKQLDLNKEILRMNEYDLEKSVDELCGVSEWDPILEELQEMGFSDNETNKRLLKKNNGSIKRVVLDLINGEKSQI